MGTVGEHYRNLDHTENYDAVVIGSGIGGLGVAALLASEAGKRVLVLERHTVAGGFTHTFSRKGWEWDTGLHYVGGVQEPDSFLRRIFDRVTQSRLEWQPTGDIVDRIVIGDQEFEYLAGRKRWRERMLADFPAEEAAIDRFLELVGDTRKRSMGFFGEKAVPAPIAFVFGRLMRRGFLKHSDRLLGDVLDALTDDQMLKAVLSAQYGDHGMPPAQASFAMHAMVFAHYLEGAAYPKGGSAAIAEAIAPTIEATGGRIVVGAEVVEILTAGNRVTGVQMAEGDEILCSLVISDVGIPNTAGRLLPEGTPGRRPLLEAAKAAGPSVGHCCLHIGLEKTAEELGLPMANIWVYPGEDHDESLRRFEADPTAPLPLVFISFPSAKDPDFERRHPGRATIEVTTFAPYERFSRWQDQPAGRRDEGYVEMKKELSDRLLQTLYQQVPQVEGEVAFHDLSTPLTTRWFCNYEHGEVYGLNHGPARFRQRALKPKTPIKGLWLTGQDACTAGIAGALLGGVLSASAILGRNLLKTIS